MARAALVEVFSSWQGEGTHVGEPQVFVRFQDCELSCRFCDTPQSFVDNPHCRVEDPPFSKRFRQIPNPLSVPQLNEILAGFDDPTLSVTGGEPLQKTAFLKEWLPTIHPRFRVLLETAGVHWQELAEVLEYIDIVSMDLKLPSSTGMRDYWKEHEAFLRMACVKEVYVKAVVTAQTTAEDIQKGRDLVSAVDPKIPFILQPATPFAHFRAAPTLQQMADWQRLVRQTLADVRIIPQVHKQLGIL